MSLSFTSCAQEVKKEDIMKESDFQIVIKEWIKVYYCRFTFSFYSTFYLCAYNVLLSMVGLYFGIYLVRDFSANSGSNFIILSRKA